MECYVPGSSPGRVRSLTARVRAAADAMRHEGVSARLLGFISLPEEETVFCLVEASTRAEVEDLNRRAGRPADRIANAERLGPSDR